MRMPRLAIAGVTLFPQCRPYPLPDRNFRRACSVYSGRSTARRRNSARSVKAWECSSMRSVRLIGIAAAFLVCGSAAAAQTALRIGLAEDPDVLDPTLARTYVGRIVFASLCDKLFDIDDKLNIVPQLAVSSETSEDGKSVVLKLRSGVKFHDGALMDAAAVKASLDRHMTMPGSFRKPELAAVDKVEVVDALSVRLVLKSPFSPLLAQL